MKASNPQRAVSIWILAALLLVLAPMGAHALDLDEVIRLKLAGVDEETILQVMYVNESVFYLDVEDILDLRDVGCSNEFIRALMETSDYQESGYSNNDNTIVVENYEPFDDDDYTAVFIHHYYDPFAYHWYAWPTSYVYYSPFWWSRCGFYYGGHWSWDWWDPWSPCVTYCDFHYGYERHFGSSHSRIHARRSNHRVRGDATTRLTRQQKLWHHAGLVQPATANTKTRSISSRRSDSSRLVSKTDRNKRIDSDRTGDKRSRSAIGRDAPANRKNQASKGDNKKRVQRSESNRQTQESGVLKYRTRKGSSSRSTQNPSSQSSRIEKKSKSNKRSTSTPRVETQSKRTQSPTVKERPSSSSRQSSKSSSNSGSKQATKNSRSQTRTR